MDKFLKPDKFDGDPNSPTALQEWNFWLKTFENFIEFFDEEDIDDETKIEPPPLFEFLTKDIKPIITKSRKHSLEDTSFMEKEIEKLLADGIIEESRSPWRAQAFVVKNENHKKRMAMASPENETNVRVLRNRVVEKDGMSTPSKLGTPSKRATPSKLAGEVSGLTTRTRRRLSTKLASEEIAELPQSTVVINKLPDSTPSKRGRKSMDVSCKSPEVVSQENNATGRDSRMNGKDKSPKSEEKTKEDQPTISEKKKAKDDLPTILENEDQSQKSDEKMKDDQPAISEKKRTKDDLPTILENEDSENSIIENSFTLELSITDKAKNDLQKGQLNKSPSVICNPDKNDEETSVNAVSPNTLGKEVVVDSSPAKSISDVGLGESLDSDEQSERTPGKECPSIQEEEESIRSPEQEKKSVEQEKESNEVVDQEKDDSKSRGKKDQSNESVDNEGEEKKMSQLPSQSIESKLEEETDFDGSNNEIVILNEDSNNSVDKCEESSQNIIIEKEPIESIDQANESGLSVIPEECNSADSTLNTESSVILQSPLKDCRSNSESDSNVVSEVVVTLEDNISLENNDPKNICSEVESKGEDSESMINR
ncbi:protein IWS1 homolog A-like [Nilaparvata lugens]|uniref:protein IWS1 homolog A-like n=1 Tax=Nilaparvata lugens TaxID=108931 RepID=UPI00193E7831|nr:protein IWS1 homolog A-like [Nilaparvata lugens]